METLSDEIINARSNKLHEKVIKAIRVKESIRELKDILTMDGFGYDNSKAADKIIKRDIIKTINEIFGPKLT